MLRSKSLLVLILISCSLYSAEAPPPQRWMPPTHQESYIAAFKARITPLEVDSTLLETDGILETRQYCLDKQPEEVLVCKNLKTNQTFMICTSGMNATRTVIAADALEEIRAIAATKNSMNFVVSKKASAEPNRCDKKNILKVVNITDGRVNTLAIPPHIPLNIHSILPDETSNSYFLAGQNLGCGSSSYLFKLDPSDEKNPFRTLIEVSPVTNNVTSMHLDAQGNLITTHNDGTIRRWIGKTGQILVNFNLSQNALDISPIKSDLSSDKKKLFIAIIKSINSFTGSRLLSWIKVHDFNNPEQREEWAETDPESVVTDLKVIANDQLVCANLRVQEIPNTDSSRVAWQRGPHTSFIELWDVIAKTKLLRCEFKERIRYLAADDNCQRILIRANNREIKIPSFKVLDAMPEAKARTLMKLAQSHAQEYADLYLEFEGKQELFNAATLNPDKIMLPDPTNPAILVAHEPYEVEMKLDAEQRERDEKKLTVAILDDPELEKFEKLMQENMDALRASGTKEL